MSLVYNSQLNDITLEWDETGLLQVLDQSPFGGWRYAYQYGLYLEDKEVQAGVPFCSPTGIQYFYKLSLISPDRGPHPLHLKGEASDGQGFVHILRI